MNGIGSRKLPSGFGTKRLALAVATVLVVLVSAEAGAQVSQSSIGQEARPCWHIRAENVAMGVSATLSVTLDGNGNAVAADVMSHSPEGAEGAAAAEAAAEAVVQCGPYRAFQTGRPQQFTVTMHY
jgi:hypothetical protein